MEYVWKQEDQLVYMYQDVKVGRHLSEVETRQCPWWLDLLGQWAPEEELELYDLHKTQLQMGTTKHQERGGDSISHFASTGSAVSRSSDKRPPMPVNRGKEIVNKYLAAQQQSKMERTTTLRASSSKGTYVPPELKPAGTVFCFHVQVEDLWKATTNPIKSEELTSSVSEALTIVCSVGRIKGKQVDNCVDLIIADFPSNVAVEGFSQKKVPGWNRLGSMTFESTFKLADLYLSDLGYLVCLYPLEEGVSIERIATRLGFAMFRRQIVHCTPPIGTKIGHIVMHVSCLMLSVFVRSSTPIATLDVHEDQLAKMDLGEGFQSAKDIIYDVVPLEDISVRKGKPWRGTGMFGLAAAFMGRHVLMFEGDEQIYSRLLLPYRSIEL
ncbi:hypothetical protein GOP47_0023424 [Adiantum capillus-veneris]|uniref:Uncharacterized protein n=1 Tax=Adiantum capillus-veneris TaxID=13818 RepID=A0A9D4U3F5_ADICA|nr:hypothetical protein GOP47_0023424 [Adiantum capillus-veneris]